MARPQVPPILVSSEARKALQRLADDANVTLSTLAAFAVADLLDRYESTGLPDDKPSRDRRAELVRQLRHGTAVSDE